MSNIDKHAVQAVADLKACYTLGHADVAILNELARIALASLEAKPVSVNDDMAYAFHHAISDSSLGSDEVEEIKAGLRAAFANVTAPPAPVSVPDDVMAAIQKVARIRLDLNDFDGDKRGILDCLSEAEEALIEVVNRRAAMLQGAEPVTTAYKLPEPIKDNRLNSGPEADDYYSGYQAGWNELLEAVSGNSSVTPDGWVMVPVEPTEAMINAYRDALYSGESAVSCIDLYKAMIAAAPTHSGTNDGWVACSERMPGIGTEIFYFCQDDGLRDCGIVSSSNFSGKGDAELYVHAEGYDLRFGADITHWMPLPAAPQRDA